MNDAVFYPKPLQVHKPLYPRVFNRPITEEDIEQKRVCANCKCVQEPLCWTYVVASLRTNIAPCPCPRAGTLHQTETDTSRQGVKNTGIMRQVLESSSPVITTLTQRSICTDMCKTALFAQSWLCPTCGQDFCDACVNSIKLRRDIVIIHYLHYTTLSNSGIFLAGSCLHFAAWPTALPW
jgi:hypothetical protein